MPTKVGPRSLLVAAITPFFAMIVAAIWFVAGHGASLSRLAQVGPGMASDQVIAILGQPHTINRGPDGSESWYDTRGTFCEVKVHLSSAGSVTETDHDH